MRQHIVRYGGRDGSADIFDLSIAFPDPQPGDRLASASQVASIDRFYGIDLGREAFGEQCHALLAYRDFAKACCERLFPDVYGRRAQTIARILAAFISKTPEIEKDVVAYMEAEFDSSHDPDTLPRLIERAPHFSAIEAFAKDMLADIREAGASL